MFVQNLFLERYPSPDQGHPALNMGQLAVDCFPLGVPLGQTTQIGRVSWEVRCPGDAEPFASSVITSAFRHVADPYGQPTPSYYPVGFRQTVKYGGFSVSSDLVPQVSPEGDVELGRNLRASTLSTELASVDLGAVDPDTAEKLLEGIKEYRHGANMQDPPSFFDNIRPNALVELARAAKPSIVSGVREQISRYGGRFPQISRRPENMYGRAQRLLNGLGELASIGITATPPEGRFVSRRGQ